MPNRLRVAVVGAGIGERHMRAFRQLSHLYEVPVLCTLEDPRAEPLRKEYNIKEYTQNFDDLLSRNDIDIIDIATPPNTHFEFSRKAVEASKHTICEKPLFGSLAEVDEMIRLVGASGVKFMPIFQYRYGAGLQKLKRLIALDLTGRPFLTTIETHWWRGADYYLVPWRGKWTTELGGGLLGHAIHAHDILTYVHGAIAEVFAYRATLVNTIEVEDTAALAMKMANGSLVASSMTLGSRKELSRLRFCFENVAVESTLEPYSMTRDPWTFVAGTEAHQKLIDRALSGFQSSADGWTRQFELFHEAVSWGGEPPVMLRDARTSIELITAAYASARIGKPVTLPISVEHPLYRCWFPGRASSEKADE